MRMWMINPKLLCRQHLLGEHAEIHKAVGNLNHSGKWAKSLIKNNYLEPQNFLKRHDVLAKEMTARGYNHKSPLDTSKIKLEKEFFNACVDLKKAKSDLINRCTVCSENLK